MCDHISLTYRLKQVSPLRRAAESPRKFRPSPIAWNSHHTSRDSHDPHQSKDPDLTFAMR